MDLATNDVEVSSLRQGALALTASSLARAVNSTGTYGAAPPPGYPRARDTDSGPRREGGFMYTHRWTRGGACHAPAAAPGPGGARVVSSTPATAVSRAGGVRREHAGGGGPPDVLSIMIPFRPPARPSIQRRVVRHRARARAACEPARWASVRGYPNSDARTALAARASEEQRMKRGHGRTNKTTTTTTNEGT
eukprot:scaffold1190_cov393-Prasinococcus_capsulatus_cf.AAC.52